MTVLCHGSFHCLSPHPLACRFLHATLAEGLGSALRSAEEGGPGRAGRVLVIDIGYPETRGLVYTRRWGQNDDVIVVDEFAALDDLIGLCSRGVAGHVTYADVAATLVPAGAAILDGRLWYPTSVLNCSTRPTLRRRQICTSGLTKSETEILELLRCGDLTNKEIGALMGTSERTVRFHLNNIFIKLRTTDRHQTARVARHLHEVDQRRPTPLVE